MSINIKLPDTNTALDEMNLSNFSEGLGKSTVPVIVDFFATWCGPCKMMSPVMEKLKKSFEDQIKVVKIDIDKHSDIAEKYNIRAVPTTLIFVNGELVHKEVGFKPFEKISEILKSVIESSNGLDQNSEQEQQ